MKTPVAGEPLPSRMDAANDAVQWHQLLLLLLTGPRCGDITDAIQRVACSSPTHCVCVCVCVCVCALVVAHWNGGPSVRRRHSGAYSADPIETKSHKLEREPPSCSWVRHALLTAMPACDSASWKRIAEEANVKWTDQRPVRMMPVCCCFTCVEHQFCSICCCRQSSASVFFRGQSHLIDNLLCSFEILSVCIICLNTKKNQMKQLGHRPNWFSVFSDTFLFSTGMTTRWRSFWLTQAPGLVFIYEKSRKPRRNRRLVFLTSAYFRCQYISARTDK